MNIRGSGALVGLQLRYTFAYGGVLLGGLGVRRVSSLVCSSRNLNLMEQIWKTPFEVSEDGRDYSELDLEKSSICVRR